MEVAFFSGCSHGESILTGCKISCENAGRIGLLETPEVEVLKRCENGSCFFKTVAIDGVVLFDAGKRWVKSKSSRAGHSAICQCRIGIDHLHIIIPERNIKSSNCCGSRIGFLYQEIQTGAEILCIGSNCTMNQDGK